MKIVSKIQFIYSNQAGAFKVEGTRVCVTELTRGEWDSFIPNDMGMGSYIDSTAKTPAASYKKFVRNYNKLRKQCPGSISLE
ncbi:MAG: hypothetical protein RR382_00675 [Tannerellaceae bacterium]